VYSKLDLMKEVFFILMAFNGEVDYKYLQKELEDFYSVKCNVITEEEINSIAIDKRTHRYSASEILDYQSNYYAEKPSIVITSKDIAINKFRKDGGCDWGVGGLSIVNGKVSVVSLHRIKSKQLAVKVMLHEFGHGQGLPHCKSSYPCFMKDAKGILSTISRQPKDLCINCKKRLNVSQSKAAYIDPNIFISLYEKFISMF
jgi:predicted Zn-dependent protease